MKKAYMIPVRKLSKAKSPEEIAALRREHIADASPLELAENKIPLEEPSPDSYRRARAAEYLPVGDQLDAEMKARRKRKLLVGKARAAITNNDLQKAITHLLEAVEPTKEQDEIDNGLLAVKAKHPKPEA